MPDDLVDFYRQPTSTRIRQIREKERRDEIMSEMFTEISEDDLAALLAGSRRKGLYTDVLDSLDGQKAVMVNLNDGELKGKDAQTVYQGLNSAIAKNTDKYGHLKAATRTINDVKHVYIVNSAAK